MSWKYKALLHAQREDPKESCGLLLNIKGKERYYHCRNNGGHEDNLDRVVWVNMPPYLESDSRDLDIELSSKQETNKDSKN